MGTEDFVLLLLWLTVLLGIIGHLVFIGNVNKLFVSIAKSMKIASMCRVTQIESDTVRYQTWKAIKQYEGDTKASNILIGLSFGFVIIIPIIYIVLVQVIKDQYIIGWFSSIVTPVFVSLLVFLLLLVIDLALIGQLTATIKNENKLYRERKDTVIAALKAIDVRYPMFQENNTINTNTSVDSYPLVVSKFYELIIKRRATREKEATLEDAKNSLAMMARDKDFEGIFGYLKLDSTLQDGELLKRSYNNACNSMNSKVRRTYCGNGTDDKLPVALNSLGNYLPESGAVKNYYWPFYKRVQSVFAYGIFVLLVMLFPLFHMLYQSVGPSMIGAGTLVIVFGIILMSYA